MCSIATEATVKQHSTHGKACTSTITTQCLLGESGILWIIQRIGRDVVLQSPWARQQWWVSFRAIEVIKPDSSQQENPGLCALVETHLTRYFPSHGIKHRDQNRIWCVPFGYYRLCSMPKYCQHVSIALLIQCKIPVRVKTKKKMNLEMSVIHTLDLCAAHVSSSKTCQK